MDENKNFGERTIQPLDEDAIRRDLQTSPTPVEPAVPTHSETAPAMNHVEPIVEPPTTSPSLEVNNFNLRPPAETNTDTVVTTNNEVNRLRIIIVGALLPLLVYLVNKLSTMIPYFSGSGTSYFESGYVIRGWISLVIFAIVTFVIVRFAAAQLQKASIPHPMIVSVSALILLYGIYRLLAFAGLFNEYQVNFTWPSGIFLFVFSPLFVVGVIFGYSTLIRRYMSVETTGLITGALATAAVVVIGISIGYNSYLPYSYLITSQPNTAFSNVSKTTIPTINQPSSTATDDYSAITGTSTSGTGASTAIAYDYTLKLEDDDMKYDDGVITFTYPYSRWKQSVSGKSSLSIKTFDYEEDTTGASYVKKGAQIFMLPPMDDSVEYIKNMFKNYANYYSDIVEKEVASKIYLYTYKQTMSPTKISYKATIINTNPGVKAGASYSFTYTGVVNGDTEYRKDFDNLISSLSFK